MAEAISSDYLEPYIVPPRASPHKQTFIILHGRGSSGDKFGTVLLGTPVSTREQTDSPISDETLACLFPHARFVFPSAARRRATIYKRSYTHQWFDNWALDPPATDREELQNAGLRETTIYLHELIRREIRLVPGNNSKNVVLGGLSQGCAAALIALLLWDGEPLGAAFGMCGWLPHAYRMCQQLESERDEGPGASDGDDPFDPFEREPGDGEEMEDEDSTSPKDKAIRWLREEIGLPSNHVFPHTDVCQDIPLFLGHGTEDDRVPIDLGRLSFRCLRDMGIRIQWREYEGLGHWYSPIMLRDIIDSTPLLN
ncbi:Alpha/Beta hydrolase protein [Nemania sp. NC0429]|nr:Alpha/Beta hydrolase protein [Nemania sp. NC0429]